MGAYADLCHRVGEVLATAGVMDAYLRTTNSDAPMEVLDRWEDKLNSLTEHLGEEIEEMTRFAEFFDTP